MAIKYMEMAASMDCNNTIRPPQESSRACHPQRRASIFAITGCQSRAQSLPSARGSSRYRMGSEATGVASTADTRSNSKDNPMLTTDDFPMFGYKPEKSEIFPTWWIRGAPRSSIHARKTCCRLRTVIMECPPDSPWSRILQDIPVYIAAPCRWPKYRPPE